MEIIQEALAYSIRFVISTAFLLLALWLMVKIQRFQYNFPGLLGAAALAGGLDMIPYVGHFLALPALYFCLIKVTREDMTGVVFTACIASKPGFGRLDLTRHHEKLEESDGDDFQRRKDLYVGDRRIHPFGERG